MTCNASYSSMNDSYICWIMTEYSTYFSDYMDYSRTLSVLTFSPSNAVDTVQVTIIDDFIVEDFEYFNGNIMEKSNLFVTSHNQANVTITEDKNDSELVCPQIFMSTFSVCSVSE